MCCFSKKALRALRSVVLCGSWWEQRSICGCSRRERGVYCNELFSLRKAKVWGKRSCHFFTHKSALNVSKKKKKTEEEEILYRMARRKNPHPQRAVNVKTVVVGDDEEEEQEPVLCLQIPPDEDDDVFVVVDDDDDDDDDEMDEQIRKEETAFRKGSKRKRTQHECDVCEKVFG